jgi:hypothetical protein
MGVDWDRLVGQGGAYLVERAAAVQRMGRLTPATLRLVEDEAQRLKFILDEEIVRLEPAGALTPAAIATLRMLYQARLDAAESVIAAAQEMEESAPTLPSPRGGGKPVVTTHRFQWTGDRWDNRRRSVIAALELLVRAPEL